MLALNIGGVDVEISPLGSQFFVSGRLTGWLPESISGRSYDEAILEIDGQDCDSQSVAVHPGSTIKGRSGPAFAFEIPATFWNRTISLRIRNGQNVNVTDGIIQIAVDSDGNGILASQNEAQQRLFSKALQMFREGQETKAYLVFRRTCCVSILDSLDTAIPVARCFAAVLEPEAARYALERVQHPLPVDYRNLVRLAKALMALDQFDDALHCLDNALALDPVAADARNARVKAIIGRQDWEAALAEAHALRAELAAAAPDAMLAELIGTIAWLYLNLSEPDKALAEATAGLYRFPDNVRLMQMRGDALVRLSRYDEAIGVYRAGLAIDTKRPLLRKRMASALMLNRHFGEAADQDEGRMLTPSFGKLNNAPDDLPMWRGETALHGKLLVWTEVNFGVGQNILHASMIPDLLALNLNIIVEVEARLAPVFRRAFPEIEVVEQVAPGQSRGAWIDSVAAQIPIGSLGRYFRREEADFDKSRPFLAHDGNRSAELRRQVLAQAKSPVSLLVGISWTSTNPYVGDEKSVPLDQLLSALDIPGLGVVNLQYGEHGAEIEGACAVSGVELLQCHGVDCTNDLEGLCDLIGGLDLVVCIGHTTAHLAGGLGVSNLILVPSSPFAHWLAEGERCVWYPSSQIIRQMPAERGDWSNALSVVQGLVADTVLTGAQPVPTPRHRSVQVNAGRTLADFCRNALKIAIANTDYDMIGSLCRTIEARFSTDPALMELAGRAHFRVAAFDAAVRCYDTALHAGGDGAELTRLVLGALLEEFKLDEAEQRVAQYFAELDESNAAAPDQPPAGPDDLIVLHAQILAAQGRIEDAEARLVPLLERDPGHAEASLTRARCQARRGAFTPSLDGLAKCLAMTANAEVESQIGIAVGRSGLPDVGVRILDRALEIKRDPVGVFWRGQFIKEQRQRPIFPIPELEGELPEASADEVTIFVCMDSLYCAQYLKSIVSSVATRSPSARLHIHVVNPDNQSEKLARGARQLLAGGRFSYSWERAKFLQTSPEFRKTYFASIRFVRLAEAMRRRNGIYYVMDADNLVRSELTPLIEEMRTTDILIRQRFSIRPHLAVAACGIGLSARACAVEYMERTADYIRGAFECGDVAWFLDQIALTTALQEAADGPAPPTIAQLPESLLDWDFHDESIVWTGKGKRRMRNRRYLQDYRFFVEYFDDLIRAVA